MKKIAIFTLPLTARNYGGILQAYALAIFLERKGNDVELIDRRFAKSLKYKIIMFIYTVFRAQYIRVHNNIYDKIDSFVSRQIKKSKPFFLKKELDDYLNNFNILVTGSDQVWRTEYTRDIVSDLFLDFSKENKFKKISYAASFGIDSWKNLKMKDNVKSYLSDFDGISVREDTAIKICKSSFNIDNAIQHIDPTLLLKKEDYMDLFKNKISNEPNSIDLIASYVLDEEEKKELIMNKISSLLNLKVNKIGTRIKLTNTNYKDYMNYKYDGIEDWLYGIYNSSFVITDSFHGMVFSIIFEKPFIVIGNSSRGITRFSSLLKLLNLEDRLILNFDDQQINMLLKETIDYSEVNKILDNERARSNDYFNKFLK
ncbi:polysaccharide pyruvyl transferase family protein [Empedobacter falsenii]